MGSEFIIKNGYFSQGNSTITGSLIVTQGITGSLQGSSSYALTASYTTLAQTASYVLNAVSSSFASTANSVNELDQNVVISGSLTVIGNSTFYGSASFVYITASQLALSQSFISVNVFEPIERFGGLKVYDSGSSTATASLAWDSLHNHWVYQNVSGSTYTGGMLLAGPRNTGSLGAEPNLTKWFIPRSDGGDHLDNSQIYSSGSVHTVTGSLNVTGSVSVTGSQISVNADTLDFTLIGYTTPLLTLNEPSGVELHNTSGQYKISVEASQLVDDSGNNSVEWASRQLYDSSGATAVVDWNQNILSDNTAGAASVDWEQRQLLKSDGSTVVFDWENGQINSSLGITGSFFVSSSQTNFTTDDFVVNVNGVNIITVNPSDITFKAQTNISGSLNVSGSQIILNTEYFSIQDSTTGGNMLEFTPLSGIQIASTNGQVSADFETRTTRDATNINSIDWQNRQLIKSDGTTVTVDWENHYANDVNAILSIDWDKRHLNKSDSSIIVDWETGAFTGSLYGTSSWSENSISSSYALTASYVAGASSFPYTGSAQITGSLGVTGSVVATSFSGDGTNITGVTSTNVSSKLFNYYNFI